MGIMEPQVDFPRGGAESGKKAKTGTKRESSTALYGVGKKRVKHSQVEVQKNKNIKKKSKDVWVKSITLDLLCEGVLGLGVVREIHDDHLLLETSDNCRVRLPVTQIGKHLTERLKAGDISIEDVFTIGQIISFRVTKAAVKAVENGKKSLTYPIVTSDPAKLNNHLVPSHLVQGLVLHAIVESTEEKGYVLDIGLQYTKGYLPLEKTAATLQRGYSMMVRIESSTSRIVTVTSFVEQDTFSTEASEKLHLNQLMPGTILECDPIIEEQDAAGVYVMLGNGVRGFVARRHLPPRLRADPSRLIKSFRGVVMFCQQNSNLLVLCAHPDIVAISKPEKRNSFEGVEVGDIITCTVIDLIPYKFQVIFSLPTTSDGKASLITATSSKTFLHKAEECEKIYKVGSVHQCRVMDFRMAERTLIVTTRKDILKQKMVSYKDAVPGDLVKATVANPHSKGVNVKIFGSVRGFMPLHLVSDKREAIDKKYAIGKEFNCRILNIDHERKQVTITAKQSLVKKDKSINVNIESVDMVNNKIQLHLSEQLEGETKPDSDSDVAFAAVSNSEKAVEGKEITRKLKNSKKQEENHETEENDIKEESENDEAGSKKSIKNFKIYTGIVIGQWDYEETKSRFCVKVKLPGGHLGRLHISELPSKYLTTQNAFSDFLKDNIDKKIVTKIIGFTTLHLTALEKVRIADLTMIKDKMEYTKVRAKILGYKQKYKIGETVKCFISSSMKTSNVNVEVNPLACGTIPREKLADIMNDTHKTNSGSLVDVDLSLGTSMYATIERVSRSKHKFFLTLGPKKISVLQEKHKSEFAMGQLMTGRVLNINHANYGILVQLSTGQQAILGPTGISDKYERVNEYIKKFHKGELYHFYALRRDEKPRRYHVITEGRHVKYQKNKENDGPTKLLTNLEDAAALNGQTVHGFVCHDKGEEYVLVEIGPGIRGRIRKSSAVKDLPLNSIVSAVIKGVDEEKKMVLLSFQKIIYTSAQASSASAVVEKPNNKRKIDLLGLSLADGESGKKLIMEDPGFNWDNSGFTPDELASIGKISTALRTNSDKIAEKSEPPSKKAKAAANETSSLEINLNDEIPATDDDFDRLLRKDPNSADIWIKYISYFMEKDELEKAREIAERSLTVINYREEAELFNIWTAYLNLEVAYGDSVSTKAVFERACRNADSLKIHKQMASIFIANEKIPEADDIFNAMIRKFRASSDDVWYLYADHLMSTERPQEGRDLLQRALSSVPKTKHAQLICRFGQLEYQKGDAERGRTLFESLITAFPKKTDLWLVYADLTLKYSGMEAARQILERACNLPLNAHKLRPLFKKWMDFEEKHGDEQSKQLVCTRAQRLLESQNFDDV